MKKILLYTLAVFIIGVTSVQATPVMWDYTANVLTPIKNAWTGEVKIPYLNATSTATSTFAGPINLGTNHIIAHGVQSDASDGLHIHAGNGTNVGLFGVGNTANSLFYGGVNIDGATRIATTINGVLTATAGAITASGTPYVTSIVATGTTATSTFAGSLQVNGGTLFADASLNRVGIGTNSPSEILHVSKAGGRDAVFGNGDNTTHYIQFRDNSTLNGYVGYDSGISGLLLESGSSKNLVLAINATAFSNGTEALTILGTPIASRGNIGIGTTTPTTDLSVVGTTTTDVLTTTGNVGIGTTAPASPLHAYQNDTEIGTGGGMTIEQAGTGDSQLQFLLTGVRRWTMGVDNSDSDKFKISPTLDVGTGPVMTIDTSGNVGIGTTTPVAKLSVIGASSGTILQLLSDTGTKFMEVLNTGVITFLGAVLDFSGSTVKQHTYSSFTWPGTATTTSATTTLPLGTAYTAESWSGVDCWVSSSTGAFIFTDGTNRMNGATATTTVARTTLSTNNTFTAQERRYVEIGPLTEAQISCTVDKIVNN